jgi:DNA repair exonuclease SbcCD ATPase subunit
MAKITEMITGYADMTAEEKLAALEALDQPEVKPDPEASKLKTQLSKANSEAAELKRKLQEKMTEDERKAQEAEEAQKKMQEELESLRKEKTVAGYKASYLAMGYDEALAEDTAKAMADGDMSKVFANQKAYQEARDKAVLAGAVKSTPTPPAGKPAAQAVTAEQFEKMGYSERAKLRKEQPELYETLMGRK